MAGSGTEVRQQETLSVHVGRGLREVAMWLLFGCAFYLVLSLASYYPDDPGWSYTGLAESVRNAGGRAGAWFADVFLYLFGLLAYLFPVMLAWSAVLVFRRRSGDTRTDVHVLALRWLGFFVTLAAGSALAGLHLDALQPSLPTGAGGILGSSLASLLVEIFNRAGSTLIALAVFLGGFTLFTGLSWLQIVEALGDLTLKLGALMSSAGSWMVNSVTPLRRAWAWFDERRQGRRASRERAESVETERRRQAGREPPRIEPMVTEIELSDREERERQLPIFSAGPSSGEEAKQPPKPTIAASAAKPKIKAPNRSRGTPTVLPWETEAPLDVPDIDPYVQLPPLDLLEPAKSSGRGYSEEALQAMSRLVELKLLDFNVEVHVVAVHPGPVVTLFELQLAPGTKVSKITALAKDLARALSIISVRVVEVIPGKSVIGLEIPNEQRETVYLSEVLRSEAYDRARSPLTLALGKDIAGHPAVVDLGRMPHALIAGTTGSGKSVAINAMILSLLYKAKPDEVRLIMIDPKMLELSVYEGIPHLLTPVVTDMKEAANALRWCVGEMERRYRLMAAMGVRNIAGFNRKLAQAAKAGHAIPDPMFTPNPAVFDEEGVEQQAPALEPLPYIVVIIDELADMMMVVGKKVEELIARLAQKARAAGIHLLLATQRPSVDVLTGLIKANIPTRMAFQVSSRIDSRTILDQMGAEHLLGHGDMLYLAPGGSLVQRVHGAFVDDPEVHRVVECLKRNAGGPNYIGDVLDEPTEAIPGLSADASGVDTEEADPLFDEAVRIVTETRRASISGVQRRLKIGYNRAARMIEEMERIGVVGPAETNGNREVLAPPPPED